MNVFYLDKDPRTCAIYHNDKHCVKMNVEYAQLLSTAHRVLDGVPYVEKTANGRKIKRWRLMENENVIYKACHVNHPSAIWARSNINNYLWLYDLWCALCEEYTHRYGKVHECERKLRRVLYDPPSNITNGPFFEPPPAMKHFPQCIVNDDSIQSYINYYKEAKAYFSVWTNRPVPYFMLTEKVA